MKLRMAIFAAGLSLGALWVVFRADAHERTPAAPARRPNARPRDVRRRLLLVHGGAVRRRCRASYSTISGYAGGQVKNPTYEQVSQGTTGHAESVQVGLRPGAGELRAAARGLLAQRRPDRRRRAVLRPRQRSTAPAIFYEGEAQKRAARGVEAARSRRRGGCRQPIVTEIVPLEAFYPAEDYHQDFYKKNPVRYMTYRAGCGRDRRLEAAVGQGRGRRTASSRARRGVRRGKGWTAVKDGRWTKPADGRAEEEAHAAAVQGDAAGRRRSARSATSTGTTTRPGSTWTSSRASRSSPRSTSSTRAPAGRASRGRSRRRTWRTKHGRLARHARAPRCARSTPTRTSATSSTTARSPTGLRYCMNSASLRFVPAREARRGGLRRVQEALRQDSASK